MWPSERSLRRSFSPSENLLSAGILAAAAVASSFGAAGALIVLLYYSAQIFLLGAEFTKVYANRSGSNQRQLSGR
jgi:membrane protein